MRWQHRIQRAWRTPLGRWLYHQRREITAAAVLLVGGACAFLGELAMRRR